VSTDNQMDLFQNRDVRLRVFDAPATAEILPFPSSRLVGRARDIAAKYHAQATERAAESYWKRIQTNFIERLRDLGFADEQIAAEIDAFRDRCACELGKLKKQDSNNSDGGSAA
jgi:Family of unknown function (DUF6074)